MEKLGPTGDFAPIRRIWLGISRVGLTRSVAAAMLRSSEASSASGSDSVGRAQARPIGPEPEERSAEDTAARLALRSRRVDRAHGARLLAQGSEPHRIGARDRRRAPSRREAGGRPPPRARGEPSGNLFSDWERRIEPELSGSRRGIGTARVETRRRRVPPGDSGPRNRRRSDPGARGGARISPRPRWPHRPPGVAAGGGPSKPREVDRVPIREAARGFVAPARRQRHGICTLNRFAVAERLRG